MNINTSLIGANQGMDLIAQRKERETKLQQQQEMHQANLQAKQQTHDMNDVKLQMLSQQLDTVNRNLFTKDIDTALGSLEKTGDATF